MNPEVEAKYRRLLAGIADMGKVLVAFSGGLDSGLVVYAALKALGRENLLVVSGDSESLPRDDLASIRSYLAGLGLTDRHLTIRTRELEDENYAANPEDRCFFCKQELYGQLTAIAGEQGLRFVLDGCNASDLGDHRPGRRAASGLGVRSPLLEAGLHKEEIREIARSEGLQIWDRPQSACLASRIPYGERVTAEKLGMIEEAERFLRKEGFRQLRVRHHGDLARIELPESDLERGLQPALRQRIVARMREIGFLWVTLDLAGFRSGSMNVMLENVDPSGPAGDEPPA